MVYLINYNVMRRFVKRSEVIPSVNRDNISFVNVVYRSSDVTDEFYIEESFASDTGNKCFAVVDPIKILFAQKRLDNLGARAIETIVDSFNSMTNDPLAELRSKCSDADLKKIIKSRHLQQPCEIVAWARACEADMQNFSAELKALQEQQSKDVSKDTSSDVSVTTENT